MEGLGALIADLVSKWNMNTYVLLRIRILMGLLVCLYYIILALSFNLMSAARPPMVSVLDVASDALLVYIIGAMQAAPFKNEWFPLWALLLISFRSGVKCLSKYDTGFEVVNMLKLWAVVLLSLKHGSELWRIPFWLFWGALLLKSVYRFLAPCLLSKGPLWYGPSSELLHQYMGTDQGRKSLLVYGEPKQNNSTDDDSGSLMITLAEIWQSSGLPHRRINKKINSMKDLALAFALSRLLRYRLEGGTLHAHTISMTQDLIFSRILIEDNAEKVLFGILQLELIFLSSHLHAGYPLVFCQGFLSVSFHVFVCFVKCISYLWLFADIITAYKTKQLRGNADQYVTGLSMMIMLGVESWEILRYLKSYWTTVLVICKYVNCSSKCFRYVLAGGMKMLSIDDRDFGGPLFMSEELWITFTGCYDLLQSTNYSSGKLKPVEIKVGWATMSRRRNRTLDVMAAVIQAVARHVVADTDQIRHLPRGGCLPPPSPSDRTVRYWSACLQLPSCSHVILVCHIATSICEIELARDRGTTTRELYLFLKNESPLDRKLQKTYTAAHSLSRYCLHLLISKPNLLPGDIFVSKKVLQDTIELVGVELEGRDSSQSRGWFRRNMLDCRDWLKEKTQSGRSSFQQDLQERCNKLIEDAVSGIQDIKLSRNILQQGALVAKELLEKEIEDQRRWEILAEVWADLLVQIAPSSKVDAHRKDLEHGAELVTLIWALLCHCGIEKSQLWPQDAEEAGGTLQEHLDRKNAARAGVGRTDAAASSPAAPPPDGQGGEIIEV